MRDRRQVNSDDTLNVNQGWVPSGPVDATGQEIDMAIRAAQCSDFLGCTARSTTFGGDDFDESINWSTSRAVAGSIV